MAQSVQEIVQFMVGQLNIVFRTTDNAARQNAFRDLDACDGYQSGKPGVTTEVLIAAALDILRDESQPADIRAYGGQLLNRHLEQLVDMVKGDRGGEALVHTTVSMIPYVDIAAWIVAGDVASPAYGDRMGGGNSDRGTPLRTAAHHKLISSACGKLIATCVVHQWPDKGGQTLIDTICPGGANPSLASLPNTLRLVLDFVRICAEPPYKSLSNSRISQLKRGLMMVAPTLCKVAVAALDQQYTYLKGVVGGSQGDTAEVVHAVCADMECAIEILSHSCARLVPMIPLLWENQIDTIFSAIVSLASQLSSSGGFECEGGAASPSTMICAAIDLVTNLTNAITSESLQALRSGSQADVVGSVSRLTELISAVLFLSDGASSVASNTTNKHIVEKVGRLLVEGADKMVMIDAFLDDVIPNRPPESPLRLRRTAAIAASLLLKVPSVVLGSIAAQSLNTLLRQEITNLSTQVEATGTAVFFDPMNEEDRLNALRPLRAQLDVTYDVSSILANLAILSRKNALNPWKSNRGDSQFHPLCQVDHPNQAERARLAEVSSLAFIIAQDEFMDMDQYVVAYGELRAATASLLVGVAALFPIAACEFLQHLIQESLQLTTQQQTSEPTTRFGHVTQHGEIYPRWEGCVFMLTNLLEGISRSPFASTQQIVQMYTFLFHNVLRHPLLNLTPNMDSEVFPDAVLAPQFLNAVFQILRTAAFGTTSHNDANMVDPSEGQGVGQHSLRPLCLSILLPKSPLVVLWEAGHNGGSDVGLIQIVQQALEVIAAFMDLRCGELRTTRQVNRLRDDEDLLAARKRSFTLLINVGTTVNVTVAGSGVGASLLAATSRLMMNSDRLLPQERSLLLEAVVSLSSAVSGLDMFITLQIKASVSEMERLAVDINADRLAYFLTTNNRSDVDFFGEAKAGIDTVSKVLKRCNPSPTLQDLVMSTMGPIGSIIHAIHQLSDANFPPEYRGIIDPVSGEEHDQLRSGGGVKRPANLNSVVERTRKALSWLRRTVYEYISYMSRFVPVETFGSGLSGMLQGCEGMPPQVMTDFMGLCLYPLASNEPRLVSVTVAAMASYLGAVRDRYQGTTVPAVAFKKLFFLSKDMCTFIAAATILGCSYEEAKKAGVSLKGGATSVTAPKGAAFPFLVAEEGRDVLLEALHVALLGSFDLKTSFALGLMAWNAARSAAQGANETGTQQLRQFTVTLFGLMVVGAMTNPFVDRPDTRPWLLEYLCELYLAEFPLLEAAFTTPFHFNPGGGAPLVADGDCLQGLHAQMATARSNRHKKDIFASFVCGLFGMEHAPPSRRD